MRTPPELGRGINLGVAFDCLYFSPFVTAVFALVVVAIPREFLSDIIWLPPAATTHRRIIAGNLRKVVIKKFLFFEFLRE